MHETTNNAYETAMSAVDAGEIFGAVPAFNGEKLVGVWITSGKLPVPRNTIEVLAQAFAAIKKAREEAEKCGYHV